MSVVLTKEPISGTMHGRGGFPVKTLIYAVFVLLLVYMFFIYHGSQNSLREAEMIGSRYRREAEERVTEIQELVRAKDRFQETCQNEKAELHNRIKSLNQQYSMLQSQYKETEADFIKLKQDMDTMRAEHAQSDSSHAAEYEKLKQEKENDIAKLKDEVADLTRQGQSLENTVASLRLKLQETENAYKHLLDQNGQLQQQLQNKPLPQYQQELHPHVVVTQQTLDKQDQYQNHGLGVTNVRKIEPNQFGGFGQVQGDQNHLGHGQWTVKPDTVLKDDARPVVDDNLNALHQVRPPNNNNNFDSDVDGKDGYKDVNFQPEVNPNDEQKAQIVEPVLDHNDRHQGGGEDGVVDMNVRREEEAREKNVKDEEADSLQHKNPLALGQIEIPGELKDLDDSAGQNKNNVGQQAPPLLNEENEQKERDRGENHYFGEDEDADQQQQQQQQQQEEEEEERQRMEEEERDERDFENNVNRFPDDLGNKDNKDAALADVNNE